MHQLSLKWMLLSWIRSKTYWDSRATGDKLMRSTGTRKQKWLLGRSESSGGLVSVFLPSLESKEAMVQLRRHCAKVTLLGMQWTQNSLHGRGWDVYISKGCIVFQGKRESQSWSSFSMSSRKQRVIQFTLAHHKYPQEETSIQDPGYWSKKKEGKQIREVTV